MNDHLKKEVYISYLLYILSSLTISLSFHNNLSIFKIKLKETHINA